jgi:transcriptional regulator with XRE-family HTH domain
MRYTFAMEIAAKYQQESRRLADLLLGMVRFSGRNVRSIERELGVANGAIGKVLNGTVRLQVDHILIIVDLLGLTPAQFFQRAYSRQERLKPHRFDKLLEMNRSNTAEEDDLHLEALVRRVLREILGKALSETESAENAPEPPSPENPPPKE